MIGGDFDVPIMYQDLANSTMGPMSIPLGTMSGMYGAGMYGHMGNTNYLGGVQMRRQPDKDKVQIMNQKENQDKNTAKKVLIGLGAMIVLGSIPVLRKSIKKSGGIVNYVKKLFSPSMSLSDKIKNGFKAVGRGVAWPFKVTGKCIAWPFKKIGQMLKKTSP